MLGCVNVKCVLGRDAEQARKVLDAYEANHSLGNADEAMEVCRFCRSRVFRSMTRI